MITNFHFQTESIMQYRWNAFAKDSDKPTIYPKNGPGVMIEPYEDFSLVTYRFLYYIYTIIYRH